VDQFIPGLQRVDVTASSAAIIAVAAASTIHNISRATQQKVQAPSFSVFPLPYHYVCINYTYGCFGYG
jgi:hypothetical protein